MLKCVNRLLPEEITEQILSFPESSMGAHRVAVVLKDGRRVGGVKVAWGNEVVGVEGSPEIPFDTDDVIAVYDEPKLNRRPPG